MNEEHLRDMNPVEKFLRRFINSRPEYGKKIIGLSDDKEAEYARLMDVMRSDWQKQMAGKSFFMEGTTYHIEEDFFIPESQNASVVRNLRYMPLILHSHQFIELNYVISSHGSTMITRYEQRDLKDGDVILCPPGLTHCFGTHNKDSIIVDIFLRVSTFDTAFFNLLSDNNYLSAVFSNALYSPREDYIIWHCPDDSVLKQIILDALSEYESDNKYKGRMLEILVMEFFLNLMRNYEYQAEFFVPRSMSSNEQFQTMMNYMRAHFQTVTLTKLAEQYNYSERQTIRLIKKHSGKSFSELLLEIRMNKAVQLLQNSSMPVQQIAHTLGFSSTAYFSRVFEKYYGQSFGSIRKKGQE